MMLIYNPTLAGVFVSTLPLYGAMMWWSSKVLRPLFADIEESQGKYSSHQIDAIKGIESVKSSASELARSATPCSTNSWAFRARCSGQISCSRPTTACCKPSGCSRRCSSSGSARNQVLSGAITVGGFVAFSSLTAMAYGSILHALGLWDQWQIDVGAAQPAQ